MKTAEMSDFVIVGEPKKESTFNVVPLIDLALMEIFSVQRRTKTKAVFVTFLSQTTQISNSPQNGMHRFRKTY